MLFNEIAMNLISKSVLLSMAVSFSALAGIDISTPLASGNVATIVNRHETSHRDLSPIQLQALSRWLGERTADWHGMITEASSEPSSLQISLKDKAGNTGSIAVIARADGSHYLRFISSSEQWSYSSFGGLVKSWAATRQLSEKELTLLRDAVGTAN